MGEEERREGKSDEVEDRKEEAGERERKEGGLRGKARDKWGREKIASGRNGKEEPRLDWTSPRLSLAAVTGNARLDRIGARGDDIGA